MEKHVIIVIHRRMNLVIPPNHGESSRSRRGGSGVERGGDACVALGGVAIRPPVLGRTGIWRQAHNRKEKQMYDERERFLIRYSHNFASFIVARASGAWLETTDGRRILDFTSGQICSTIGHNHPQIVAAIQQSLDEVIHLNSWMLSEPVLALAERLVGLVPASLNKVILVNTGGEANEIALRLAKMYTGRFEMVGLTRSWHGLQAGVASLNLAGGHAGYGPIMPGTFTLPAP